MPSILSKACRKTCNPLTSVCDNDCEKCKERRLTVFATEIYNLVKPDYSATQYLEQKDFVEGIVDTITKRVAGLNPFWKSSKKLPNGSFFQGTKILNLDEFDFLNPLDITANKSDAKELITVVQVEGKPGERHIKVSPRFLELLSHVDDKSEDIPTVDETGLKPGIRFSNKFFLNTVNKAVVRSLQELDKEGVIAYKGQNNFVSDSGVFLSNPENVDPDSLKYKEVVLRDVKGPVVTLSVGGPLCVSHVDIGYCFEDHQRNTDGDRYFVLPCKLSPVVWMPTKYTPGTQELDQHHQKVLMILKYFFSQTKRYRGRTRYSSHVLKTIVRHHKNACSVWKLPDSEVYLGKCLLEAAQGAFRLLLLPNQPGNQDINISPKWLESLENFSYPRIRIIGKYDPESGDVLITVVLFILMKFMSSSPEVLDLVKTRSVLSVCIQMICKTVVSALDMVDVRIPLQTWLYNRNIPAKTWHNLLDCLRDLRFRGGEINYFLSSPPHPYPKHRLDPSKPVSVSLGGTLDLITDPTKQNKWKDVIEKNLIKKEKETDDPNMDEKDRKKKAQDRELHAMFKDMTESMKSNTASGGKSVCSPS